MDGKIEQCICIKFCLKLGKSATETLKMPREAFREHSISRTAVFDWHSRFKAGRVSAEDYERSGRPNTSKTMERVKKIDNGFLAKHDIPQVRQAPYSPDMAPSDFWLFPRLKTPLKGCRFDSRKDIIQNAKVQLHAIPKEVFQNCFQRWKDRWAKCVESQGAYSEGD
ncbi:hypothetical protein B7P43_G10165 [Cryptotermes secundus]|uniref:Mos1 transposase HTH domain-containing protein n=1 Tax=Cryptotermes secundus TaxID=105785 RepID=A0A2J7Q8H8_9NEOP|nr:hypothetical protein B7P43_G10165 [Cryptotermes secundus]